MFTVRAARANDVDSIVALITREIVEGVAHFGTEPPPREQIALELESPYPFVVAEHDEDDHHDEEAATEAARPEGTTRPRPFLGFARATAWKARGGYAWTAEVGVYVAHDRHRRGLGRALVEHLLERMRGRGFRTVLAGIALPNPSSVGLFERLGFRHAGTFPAIGFKHGAWRDVGYWTCDLGEGEPGPSPV